MSGGTSADASYARLLHGSSSGWPARAARPAPGPGLGPDMLKFLTHKLRTHSLNEEPVGTKVEEHDSGTESDDEAERDEGESCADVIMKWSDATDIKSCGAACGGGCACAAQAPDLLYDHHSSEEELEVINGAEGALAVSEGVGCAAPESRRRGASSPPVAAPEKRKWPRDAPRPVTADDDDDDDTKVETPVRFRTSPPLEALKPRRSGAGVVGVSGVNGLIAASEPASSSGRGDCACGAQGSPRRRRQAAPPPRRHRPALDFDKMQQLKVGGAGVRSWRGAGGAGGELSVFCW